MHRSLQAPAFALLSALAVLAATTAAQAGSAWDEIRPNVFGSRAIHPAADLIRLTAPTRPTDQRAVPIAVEAAFKDGRTIKAVTLIVDENPTPIAAVFDIGGKRDEVRLATNLRLNAATDVRAIVEASDGALYMASQFVKFAGGQASCSAPPQGDPELIAANMGKMTFEPLRKTAAATEITPRARITVSHPNHTGMVLDQMTLLYIPLRIVTDIDVRQGDERIFAMRGSMTMSQNPMVEFDYKINGAQTMHVLVNDSDGASWQQSFPIGQGS
jgi:sulfur-oxidizing protein SoxY